MALAKHASVRLNLSDLLGDASDFTRDAWRDCWAPMLAIVVAHVLTFMGQHVAASEWSPGPWGWLTPLLFIFYVPLYGGLYRAALGGPRLRSLGPAGLQWSGAEWRLIAVTIVFAFIVGVVMTPFLAATAIAALIMGLHQVMSAGPFGQWARWTPAALVIWLIFFWLMGGRIARLALGWPYSVARGKTEPFAGWGPSHRSGWAIAWAFLIVQIPSLIAMAAPAILAMLEPDTLSAAYWPLPEAIGIGLVQGVLYAVVQAPLSVGVLAGAYYFLEEAMPDDLGEGEAHAAPLDEAALAAASAHEAAELDLPPSEIDRAHGEGHEGEAAEEGEAETEGEAAHHATDAETTEAATEDHDPPPPSEAHTVDPALEGAHPAEPPPATDAAADEAAAAAHVEDVAAHAPPEPMAEDHLATPAEPHVEAHAEAHDHVPAEAAHIDSQIEAGHAESAHAEAAQLEPEHAAAPVEAAPEHDVHPEPAPAVEHHGGMEPLSPWPHSVLPPWPTGVNTDLARRRLGLPPLASRPETPHPRPEMQGV